MLTTPEIDKCVELCWEYQRKVVKARQEGWPMSRLKLHANCQLQLMRRFSSGVRSSAQNIFMEQMNDELRKSQGQRNPLRPVILNELYDVRPTGTGGTIQSSGALQR